METSAQRKAARSAASVCGTLVMWGSIVLSPPSLLHAQGGQATLRGRVLEHGQPVAQASVVARNVATGFVRHTQAVRSQFVLVGLEPGTYRLEVSQANATAPATRSIRLFVGETRDLDVELSDTEAAIEGVTVVADRSLETGGSEVATTVTELQIEALPQNNRNFLNFAALAPGVRINERDIEKTFQAGALSANSTNVYIDGLSFKNQVIQGGIVGQDASRGNPFPQNAIREFRVVTQNFKAEYEHAGSAIITARTRSGTNELESDAFVYYQNKDLVARDDFAQPGEPRADFDRYQYGLSLGGPIIADRMHFFVAYEGNDQDRGSRVAVGFPPLRPLFREYEGTFTQPFREDLFFGKLDYQPSAAHNFALSVYGRDESDIKDFGNTSSHERAMNVRNNVQTVQLTHSWSGERWTNEASAMHMKYSWNPRPVNPDLVGREYLGVITLGGASTSQDIGQDVYTLEDELTLTALEGLGTHVLKTGLRLSRVDYEVSKRQRFNPFFRFLPEVGLELPAEAEYGSGDPNLSGHTTQVGWYLQDDWSLSPRLTLNLGVRWDYDTNLLNDDYVTPPEVVAAVESLVPARYLTDGNDRESPQDLIQPRLGLSFDLFGDARTVLYGGIGRYIDRVLYNEILDERLRRQWQVRRFLFSADGAPRGNNPTIPWDASYMSREGLDSLIAAGVAPNPEIFLIENDTRMPETIQSSIGVRQRLGRDWLGSLTFARNRSRHGFSYILGNRNPDGSCCAQVPGGFGNLLLSTDDKQAWYTGVYLTLEKAFSERSPWGLTFSYTYGDAEETGGDLFSLDHPTIGDYPRHPTISDEKHRVVMSAIIGLPWQMRLSTLITLGSGTGYNIDDFSRGPRPGEPFKRYYEGRQEQHSFIVSDAWAYRTVDLRLEKSFTLYDQELSLVAEAFNVFDYENYDPRFYNGAIPAQGVNEAFGKPNRLIEPGRRLQFGATMRF